jgi:hypothetical protein
MLLYWGMILRFVTSMALWQRLRPPDTPANDLSLGPVVLRSPWRKVTVELLIVAFTRQAIYRTHEDPLLYIHLGNLHHYHLGWIAGVPLWIVLWWALAVLIWKDLSARLVLWLAPRRIQSE